MNTQAYPDLDLLVASHGHLCPGLAMGYRAARYALKMVDRGPGLVVYSGSGGCPLHAIEMLTGCSRDSGTVITADGEGWAFYDSQSDEGLRITLKKELAGHIAGDRDRNTKLLLTLPDNALFDLEAFSPPGSGDGGGV
ncbi:MAG: formylmethanofuran dehydrogenase subunit E family protein [Actinobacteria bacterium]|nr:formylmethanofuran dehydrogenase subunit E family protein [Actinomycetota bacterium]